MPRKAAKCISSWPWQPSTSIRPMSPALDRAAFLGAQRVVGQQFCGRLAESPLEHRGIAVQVVEEFLHAVEAHGGSAEEVSLSWMRASRIRHRVAPTSACRKPANCVGEPAGGTMPPRPEGLGHRRRGSSTGPTSALRHGGPPAWGCGAGASRPFQEFDSSGAPCSASVGMAGAEDRAPRRWPCRGRGLCRGRAGVERNSGQLPNIIRTWPPSRSGERRILALVRHVHDVQGRGARRSVSPARWAEVRCRTRRS